MSLSGKCAVWAAEKYGFGFARLPNHVLSAADGVLA